MTNMEINEEVMHPASILGRYFYYRIVDAIQNTEAEIYDIGG